MAGLVAIFVLAAALATVPALIDRWALRNGASPHTLAVLAIVTIVGIAAVPVTFVICTGTLAPHSPDRDALSVASLGGLLLVALAAGRTLARMVCTRRRWRELSRLAAALQLAVQPGGIKVLPVGELLAFVSGTDAFISQGLIDRLTPAQRRAVIEHEREHAQGRHARLVDAARALAHGSFDLQAARRAAGALDRELDALADQAAAQRIEDPLTVQDTLRAVASATTNEGDIDPATIARIQRLSLTSKPRPRVDAVVRLVTLALATLLLASICLSIHTSQAWLGALACLMLVAGFLSFTRPALKPNNPPTSAQETPMPEHPAETAPTAKASPR